MAAITFACGTPHGGAVESTVALASCAAACGHRVRVIVAAGDPYATRPRTTAALVRAERLVPPVGRALWRMHDRVLARTTQEPHGDLVLERASDVPAAAARLHEPGGVLVINSVRRLDLVRLVAIAARTSSRTVWYLREVPSLAFAGDLGGAVDVLLANSRPLVREAARRAGRDCSYVPSVIDRDGLREPVERRAVLLVNPVPEYGLETTLALAAARPDRPFVLQESWPLVDAPLARLTERLAELPNVELRARTARAEVFRDAWVMVAPHAADVVGLSRPRVALESQMLGVPMLAADIEGLAAVAASPDLLVAQDAGLDGWLRALDLVEAQYEHYSDRARAFADAEVLTPQQTWEVFVDRVAAHVPRASLV